MENRDKNFPFDNERGEGLYQKFEEAVRDFSMDTLIEGGVLLGFSGGADSVMLAYLLLEYRRRHAPFPILLCHVNHGIRDGASDRDEDFCRAFAEENSLELIVRREDVPRIARETSVGIERVARDIRYSIFEDIISGRNDICSILTAHNATDNLETFLFVSMRGAGSNGLAGIPPVRGRVLRPMLYLSSGEIREHLKLSSIPYVIDESNLSTEYSRNYIRHEILPRLSRLSPTPEVSARRISRNLRDDDDFIMGMARQIVSEGQDGIPREQLLGLHVALFCRVLRLMAVGCIPEEHHIRKLHMLLHSTNVFSYSLPMGYTFVSDGRVCRVLPREAKATEEKPDRSFSDGRISFPELDAEMVIGYDRCKLSSSKVYKFSIHKSLSSAIIEGELYCRVKTDGDSYVYGGMTRRLKKLYNDRKLPWELRASLPILCDGRGIVYVPGFGVREDTKNAVENPLEVQFFTNNEQLYRLLEDACSKTGARKEKERLGLE